MKRLFVVFILASTILILKIMFSNFFSEMSSQKLFDDGIKAYQNGDSKTAVDKLSNAIKKEQEKNNPDKKLLSNIYNIRGEVYLSVGVAVLSQSDFTHALDYNSTNEAALNNLGIWFSMEKFSTPDYKKSIDYFDKAITLRPDRKDIILNRAVIKIKSGDNTGCDDLKKLDADGYPNAKIGLQQFCKN